LIRRAWTITRHSPALWVLHVVLGLVGVPALVLGALVGGLFSLRDTWPANWPMPQVLVPAANLPQLQLVMLWLVGLVLLIVTSAASGVLIGAIMRGVGLAGAGQVHVSWRACWSLGAARVRRILLFSLVVGVATSLLAWVPVALPLAAPGSPLLNALSSVLQLGLGWVQAALAVALTIVLISVSVEDIGEREAPGRAWQIFKAGWWGFLLVFSMNLFETVALAGVIAVAVVGAVLALAYAPSIEAGTPLAIGVLLASTPFLVFISLFSLTFSNVLYALVYRSAAQAPAP
jgi:hypothetical protein